VGEMAWRIGQPVSFTEVSGGRLRPDEPVLDGEWLDRQLAAGKSVIANGRLDDGDQSFDHFMTVVGRTDNGKYVINDPWTNRQLEYSNGQLKHFLQGNSVHGGAMMAIGGDQGFRISEPVQHMPGSKPGTAVPPGSKPPATANPPGPSVPQSSPPPPAAPSAPVPGTPRSAPDPQPAPAPEPGVLTPVATVKVKNPAGYRSTRVPAAPMPETAPFRPLQPRAVAPVTASQLALKARQPIAV